MSINEVKIDGRCTRDAELRHIGNGTALCSFSVAQDKSRKVGEKWEKIGSMFFEVNVWGQAGEAAARICKKGQGIYLEGRLDFQTWKDEKTGTNRSKVLIVAKEVRIAAWSKIDKQEETIRKTFQDEEVPF